jgi:hypothetical protein
MRTADGGRHWQTTRVTPFFFGTRDVCNGGDPTVAYSRRDHVVLHGQLCFFRTLPYSEVQIYVSRDNGRTWTPGRQAARAATNFDYGTGTVDASVFNDKEYIAVDNHPVEPALRPPLRRLHQVPHAAQRVLRLLPAAALLYRHGPTWRIRR